MVGLASKACINNRKRLFVLIVVLLNTTWLTFFLWWGLTPASTVSPSSLRSQNLHQQQYSFGDTNGEGRRHNKYLVVSAAVGYTFYSYERFITTLRRHYSGDVVLLVGRRDIWAASLVERCFNSSVRIVPLESVVDIGAKGDRYVAYAEHCENYTMCLATDFRDVFFQDNPFKNIPSNYEMILSEEESTGIGYTGSNKRWISSCWGDEFLKRVADTPPVCSGTIYGTPAGFKVLRDLMIDEMRLSAEKKCIARDQGHLNYLLLSKQFPFPVLRQIRGYGLVNTLARMKPAQARLWLQGGGVRNEDGSLSPVVHHYDRFGKLEDLLERFLEPGFPNDVRQCSRWEMTRFCLSGLLC
eukprot:gb/GECG01004446.1/.p1 GENE.gb/GECG01004446.1/~~gb/GECG01004446.1/.p1  ORF type:complete len:355 (+),score=28.17 gb/GECG01004446.1/:1-1065(+)